MASEMGLYFVTFIAATSFVLLVFLLVKGGQRKLDARLSELSGKTPAKTNRPGMANFAKSALPKVGAPLIPKDEKDRTFLQSRLIHAGFYNRQALYFFLGAKMLLVIGPLVVTAFLIVLHVFDPMTTLISGAFCALIGLIAPSFWLDWMKSKRQSMLRRAMPDALDVLVICLEGGSSLQAALQRVANELRTAHPGLGKELIIAQRESQLGWSTGEALRRLADRTDLEEVRSLAAVITQAEKYGASLAKALRVHSDTLREKRLQQAEELAQKAAIKILFPTLLFIFPAIFIVILGPAVVRIFRMFSHMRF